MSKNQVAEVKKYYHSIESMLGYRLMTKGVKHFGYHPDPSKPLSLAAAQRAQDKLVAHCLKLNTGANVLECGCGEGSTANYLARRYRSHITGVDLLPRNIARARRTASRHKTGASFLVADYMQLPFDTGTFDAVYALETLVHASSAQELFEEIFRVLKPGGKLVFCEYSMTPRADLSTRAADTMTKINTYGKMPALEEFITGSFPVLLSRAGFVKISVKDLTTNALPTLRYFYDRARWSNRLVKALHAERHFINTYTAAEIYTLSMGGEDVVRYNLVAAVKPR